MAGPGHNSGEIAADHLRSFIQRIERLEAEIEAMNTDKSEIYKEMKAVGFVPKTVRKVIQRRRAIAKDRQSVAEHDALYELYLAAAGEG